MGLTKERGPDPGDLSETSPDGYQVWAVGFYNRPGAAVLGDIFAQPCNPSLPVAVKFPADTASIKFLFTDASTDNVTYLKDGPEYDAYIDPPGSGSSSHAASERKLSQVRLLQVDIAIKDAEVTRNRLGLRHFRLEGPAQGDKLFDNLVPVSLQWGNDPGVYDASIRQSWINPDLRGVTYGWRSRPTLGFMGRANGPADNIRSSCLSCHAAGRTPRALIGLLDNRFDMTKLYDPALVKSTSIPGSRTSGEGSCFSLLILPSRRWIIHFSSRPACSGFASHARQVICKARRQMSVARVASTIGPSAARRPPTPYENKCFSPYHHQDNNHALIKQNSATRSGEG
ncbi:hypothetical protein U8P76_28830 (plasmid) [Rhizobium johnstonii]|nr:hypothetical protein U8P76_28830 [Rhizobium johnstonii]